MNYVMENEKLRITVDNHGAELTSVYDKENDREVLWQADPKYWDRHSPILFPNVGKYYKGGFKYNGKFYPAKQHGFAKDMDFEIVRQSENSISYRLTDTAETLKEYPFPFVFDYTYVIEGGSITVKWYVENTGDKTMYFTIGGHPGFNVPILPDTKQTDYNILFKTDDIKYYLVDLDTCTVNLNNIYTLDVKNGAYRLTEGRFDKDALVLKEPVDWVGIGMPDGKKYVSVSCKGFHDFGIWSAPGAPFICLEPWDGRTDNTGFDGEISEKPDIIKLESGKAYNREYTITVY